MPVFLSLFYALSLSLSVATVSTALCAPVLFTLLTYLLNQIRLFFYHSPYLSPSLSLSPCLLCTLCPYCTHIYLSKKPYGSFISMQCTERKLVARFECSQAKCVSNPTGWNYLKIVFAYTLTRLHTTTFYSYFWLVFYGKSMTGLSVHSHTAAVVVPCKWKGVG